MSANDSTNALTAQRAVVCRLTLTSHVRARVDVSAPTHDSLPVRSSDRLGLISELLITSDHACRVLDLNCSGCSRRLFQKAVPEATAKAQHASGVGIGNNSRARVCREIECKLPVRGWGEVKELARVVGLEGTPEPGDLSQQLREISRAPPIQGLRERRVEAVPMPCAYAAEGCESGRQCRAMCSLSS